MRSIRTLRRRSLAIPFLALLAIAALGGCSVGGGVSGSIGGAGAHIGANLDFGILDGSWQPDSKERYRAKTAYAIPNHKASP